MCRIYTRRLSIYNPAWDFPKAQRKIKKNLKKAQESSIFVQKASMALTFTKIKD
jgi:hypothetical protein